MGSEMCIRDSGGKAQCQPRMRSSAVHYVFPETAFPTSTLLSRARALESGDRTSRGGGSINLNLQEQSQLGRLTDGAPVKSFRTGHHGEKNEVKLVLLAAGCGGGKWSVPQKKRTKVWDPPTLIFAGSTDYDTLRNHAS